jgi:hypothetical protein
MAELPTRYYVQQEQSHSRYEALSDYGWRTMVVTFGRASADAYAARFESAAESLEELPPRIDTPRSFPLAVAALEPEPLEAR